MATNERLKYLFQNWLDKNYSIPERDELFGYLGRAEYDADIKELIEETWNGHFAQHQQSEEDAEAIFQRILEIGREGRNGIAKKATPVKRMWRWVAAASIIIIVGILVMLSQSKHDKTGEPPLATHDVSAPTETRAVITLADGRKIYLDSADNGTLALENDVNVIKTADGKVVYSHEGAKAQSELVYNTLTNPRGSKVIDMTLSDGSHVWLNAGSSVKYPVAFIGKERIVEMTGEAYFEVKHNAQQPFKVHLPNGSVVEDIGTSFNINAYTDESDIKTTLIEGSVKVESPALTGTPFSKGGKPTHSVVLSPGQQAVATGNSLLTTRSVDTEEVMAWKNGLFQFNNADIETVMRQVARWYDVEVVYESRPTKIFRGGLPRNLSAMKVFKLLEETGGVHFRIEGRKVIVLQ